MECNNMKMVYLTVLVKNDKRSVISRNINVFIFYFCWVTGFTVGMPITKIGAIFMRICMENGFGEMYM